MLQSSQVLPASIDTSTFLILAPPPENALPLTLILSYNLSVGYNGIK